MHISFENVPPGAAQSLRRNEVHRCCSGRARAHLDWIHRCSRDALTRRAASAKVCHRDLILAHADAATDARIGTVVDDKYRIARAIGCGAVGCVYEAEHTVHRQRVALKLMPPECAPDRETFRRFQNEVNSAGHLDHPNIAAVMGVGSALDGSPYVVREYLTGHDCARLLSTAGPLPVARVCDIVYQACLGLFVAHQAGIVHRSIKPRNLFVTRAADGKDLVKILDFGMARLRVPGAGRMPVSGGGRLYCLAPEQLRDTGTVDGRADVWALGTVLYELLTGQRPFDGPESASILHQIAFEAPEAPDELRPGLPVGLVSAIDLALEKDPEKRFETVLTLAAAIGPFTGRPVRRGSNLAVSQRLPLLTPVDAAYDTNRAVMSASTNAPVARTVVASRQRAYRVYSLLLVAGLVGFSAGWVTRRVLDVRRVDTAAPVAAFDDAHRAAPGMPADEMIPTRPDQGPPVASPAEDAMPDAGLPLVAEARAAGSVVALTPLAPAVSQNAPMRLVRASPDAGTLRAEVDQGECARAVPVAGASASAARPVGGASADATQTNAPGPGAAVPSGSVSATSDPALPQRRPPLPADGPPGR